LACYKYLHACGLDVVDMDKNIRATVIGRDKAISAICVEEFDPPTWHAQLIQSSAKRVMPERVMPQKAACRLVTVAADAQMAKESPGHRDRGFPRRCP
jgi:hypothetical protein